MGDAVCNHPSTVSVVRPTALHSPSIPRRTMVIVVRLAMVTVVSIRMTTIPIVQLVLVVIFIPIFILRTSSYVALRVTISIIWNVLFLSKERLSNFKII